MTTTSSSTMKAALVSEFGPPNQVLTVSSNVPKPAHNNNSDNNKNKKTLLLLRVHATSLSPGDYRGLLGEKTIVATPKEWPYIPGGDVAGTIEEIIRINGKNETETEADCEFRVGDRVMATWDMFGTGGLAEYAWVDAQRTCKLPQQQVSFVEGAALANSASHALLAVRAAKIRPGDRVLVLGGSGGVGTCVVQLLKRAKAGYVCVTSTDEALMKSLGADRVVNYKTEEEAWWEMEEFQREPFLFDVIIDCAVGKEAWEKCGPVLKGRKDGGRFLAVIWQDWYIDGTSWYRVMVGLMLPVMIREYWNVFRRSAPSYHAYLDFPTKDTMKEVVDLVAKKELKVVIDPKGPHPFTTDGVRAAFNHHIARAGHGKIVVKIV